MKFNKKMISLILSIVMCLSMIVPAYASNLSYTYDIATNTYTRSVIVETLSASYGETKYSYIATNSYSRMIELENNVIVASIGTKYGLIDINENIMVPFEYDNLYHISGDNYRARVGSTYTTINSRGEVVADIPYNYEPTPKYPEQSLSPWYNYSSDSGEKGITRLGEVILVDNISAVYQNFNNVITYTDTNGKYLAINSEGTTLIPSSDRISFSSTFGWYGILDTLLFAPIVDDYYNTIYPLSVTSSSHTYKTIYVDFQTGESIGGVPYTASNINEYGFFVYMDDDNSMGLAFTDYCVDYQIPIEYKSLDTAIDSLLYNNKELFDDTDNTSLAYGSLPAGFDILSNGTIYGVANRVGIYDFVIEEDSKLFGYSIEVIEDLSDNIEIYNDFEIIVRLVDISSNDSNYIFEVSGEYSDFVNLYINGLKLIKGTDYLAEEGSTKITILSQTIQTIPQGENIITTTFKSADSQVLTNGSYEETKSVSQVFTKTIPAIYPTTIEAVSTVGGYIYTAKKYDTLGMLSVNFYGSYGYHKDIFNENYDLLIKTNGVIYEGMEIFLPATIATGVNYIAPAVIKESGEELYVVKLEETLGTIAFEQYGNSSYSTNIYERNLDRLKSSTLVYENQIIVLPNIK